MRRRILSLCIVAALALVPLLITVVAGVEQPAIRGQLWLLAGVSAMGLFVSSALAVFGSFKISTLQREALAALERAGRLCRKPAGWQRRNGSTEGDRSRSL